jgi:hypothetical protein
MSRPDGISHIASSLREEIVDALADTFADFMAQMSPAARLRMVAFLHLVEQPGAVLADLDVDSAGLIRLTLSQDPGQKPIA